jgi:S1-C subfamily serine protease
MVVTMGATNFPKSAVIVGGVLPQSEAASRNFKPGDLLLRVDGEPIRCAADVNRLRIGFKGRFSITWDIWREGKPVAITTRPVPLGLVLVDF